MKKYFVLIVIALLGLGFLPSCEDDFLDQAPESGLSEKEVFSTYENSLLFFDAVYFAGKNSSAGLGGKEDLLTIRQSFPLYFQQWDQKYTLESLTDMADMGRLQAGQQIKQGSMQDHVNPLSVDKGIARRPILKSMFNSIRIANTTLMHVNEIKNAKQEDIDDLIAQAHFVRAYAHFELVRFWGPMPYIDYVVGPNDVWDIPRPTAYESLTKIAEDFQVAAEYFEKAGRMRRDGGPGEPGHLNHPEQERPNGVAALAFKSRALLYRASPLNNPENSTTAWEEAAEASWDAIDVAKQHQYALLDAADYKRNYTGTQYTNEQIWGYYAGRFHVPNFLHLTMLTGVMSGNAGMSSGVCPTQNFVDRFETSNGDPLNTEADRQAAIASGRYNPQDPYADRDPRFYIAVVHNQAPLPGWGKAEIWWKPGFFGTMQYSDILAPSNAGVTQTGYLLRKTWGEQSQKNRTSVDYTDPIMRLGELYLNYAEAANEAYGPNGKSPNASLTSVQAVNVVRNRIGMVGVLPELIGGKDDFRERVKNERVVELCFEGAHYFHDIRRWKDAPKVHQSTLIGMDIEKLNGPTPEYPTGFKYTRRPLPDNRQIAWKDAMYYFPFPEEENFKLKDFITNEVW